MRRHEIGFVFQAYNVLPVLTAEENITLPQRIGNQQVDRGWLETLIDTVHLGERRSAAGERVPLSRCPGRVLTADRRSPRRRAQRG
jgi:ABC-type lipoprotein export system ATPase subunit